MSLTVTIGSASVRLLRERIGADLRTFKREQRKHMRKAANVLRKEARAQLRAGGITRRTGTLSRFIKAAVYTDRFDRNSFIAFVGPTPRGKAYYGKFLELGVRAGSGRRGGRKSNLPPRPFLLPALERRYDEVTEILGDAFDASF